tara:strand:- start:124 stop:1149 length:1026 start_codon:yes stop_codon:yes gene_type:complete
MRSNKSSINWIDVDKIIKSFDRIMLTTHENPDGDGLGSEVAMYHHLIENNKDVKIINCSSINEMYSFLNLDDCIEHYNNSIHSEWIKSVDLVIVFDVGDFSRTREIKDIIINNKIRTMNIDHHPQPENHPFTFNYVDISSAATGCLVYDYLKTVSATSLNKNICTGIYTAVMTDTGCFKHSNTDVKSHVIASECISHGVNTNKIFQIIYENSSKERINLLGELIKSLKYELDGKLAWFSISKEMMKKTNAKNSDVEGFSDFIRGIAGVEVALMINEQSYDYCRINFRSKGNIIVNTIAKSFGGGGHAFAAGAMVNGSKKEVEERVVKEAKSSLNKQLMTKK